MAHTIGNFARLPASGTSTANPTSGSFAVGTGATVLALMIAQATTTNRAGGAPTFNGVALTQANTKTGVTECAVETWYLLNPPTSGSYTLSIPNSGGLTLLSAMASAKAGTGFTSAFDASGSTATTNSNPTVAVDNSVAGNMIFAVVATGDNGFAPSARTGTSMFEEDNGSWGWGAQYLAKADTGSQTLSWTDSTSDDYGAVAVSFKEVTAPFSLTVNDSAHAQTADNVTLTFHPFTATLTVNDASHLQTADNIELTFHPFTASLTVNDAAHAQTADNVTLTFHGLSEQLTVEDSSHAVTSDNVDLTYHQFTASLTVEDVTHLQNADSVTLTFHPFTASLTVNDASHLQNADNTELTYHRFTASLTVNDSTNLQSADSPTLMFHAEGGVQIVVQDATHLQESDNVELVAHSPSPSIFYRRAFTDGTTNRMEGMGG